MFPADGNLVPVVLVLVAAALSALSGVPLLFPSLSASKGQLLASSLVSLASLFGIAGSILSLLGAGPSSCSVPWTLPFGPASLRLDALSAVFVFVVSLVSAACSIYAPGYWSAREHPSSVRRLSFFFGTLVASLLMVVISHDGLLFLLFWEVMSLAAYFCLVTEDAKAEVRSAGTLYLIISHVSGLALFALFSLLQRPGSSFAFPDANSLPSSGAPASAVFALALLAFGLKAGLMPLHVWLPSAHASAPTHVSALLSGVVLKLGVYGILRVLSFYATLPPWWGVALLVLGIVSGILGVAFALGQHDIKRLLAYHSIENIGIIFMGMGLAAIGTSSGNPHMAFFGLAGALLHVVNHAAFKALLFLSAGAIIRGTGARDLNSMGGLARLLPWTARFFLLGSVAICGLPPLNGFVSEFLIYLGFFQGVTTGPGFLPMAASLGAPALALVGGLALACFVKVYGIVFLGEPRKAFASSPHDASRSMLAAMSLLGLACVLIGLLPWIVAPLLHRAVQAWHPSEVAWTDSRLALTTYLQHVSIGAAALIAALALGHAAFRHRLSKLPAASAPTWGCGFAAPTPRMQYSASSFAEMLVGYFRMFLRPAIHTPRIDGAFPLPQHFSSHVPEAMLDLVYAPSLRRLYDVVAPLRRLQHGHVHLYILYTFITLIVLMLIVRI